MIIVHKSVHIIEYEHKTAATRTIPDEFNEYIDTLVSFIDGNATVKQYKPRSQTKEVVNCVRTAISAVATSETRQCPEVAQRMFTNIANRLLEVEVRTQELISRLGQQVKKGSLAQALLFNEETGEFTYLAAKVEHSGFFDDADFRIRTGFPSEKQNVWKSCILECIIDDEDVLIDSARIYLNKPAKYWSNDFLELDEMVSDEKNTDTAFKSVDSTLAYALRTKAPCDYTILRNDVIGYLKRPRLVDYDKMISEIFDEYVPTELPLEDLSALTRRLRELPEKKNFERQFTAVPSAIKARIKKVYKINDAVEMRIAGHLDNIRQDIQSVEENGGHRYIKIRTDNDATFAAFKRPDNI